MPERAPFDPTALRTAAAERHKDYKIRAIAARLEAPYASVRRWTSGTGEPSGPRLADIERVYGVTPAQLWPEPEQA